ncbi:uncharacterized protein [Palaemon carinicauda]|uniref:uncharacterized protein n=1 Tax=Palaemon carinicauda TaxID=392227 RepID=UPI0035B6800D
MCEWLSVTKKTCRCSSSLMLIIADSYSSTPFQTSLSGLTLLISTPKDAYAHFLMSYPGVFLPELRQTPMVPAKQGVYHHIKTTGPQNLPDSDAWLITTNIWSAVLIDIDTGVLSSMAIEGSPHILQSDNGREFSNKVIKEVLAMWPECKLVHGKPRYSQSQGSVERANRDVKAILACWMKDNNTTQWSNGLRLVQWQKNTHFHSGISRTPYEAMYGEKAILVFLLSTYQKK